MSSANDYDMQWMAKFNQLCYEVFYVDKKGAELLRHMEERFFRCPVAFPNQDASWAYFNEGRNDHIRSYTIAIQKHINDNVMPNKK